MRHKRLRNTIAYEVIIFLLVLALILLITRIWHILFLVILGIFIAALCLLFKRTKTVEVIEPAVEKPPPPRPETEKDLLRLAYGLIQRRITEEIRGLHPAARWQWQTPNAIAAIERGGQVSIILSGAGGRRTACVKVHNLIFCGLTFETPQTEATDAAGDSESDPALPEDSLADPDKPEPVNYGYLAFEWVDAHLLDLNARANEAIGQGNTTLLIPESELPIKDSWQDICTQLIASDFADAAVQDNGIQVNLQQ